MESLTALVEHADGRLEIVDWSAPVPMDPHTADRPAWPVPLPEPALPAVAEAARSTT